MFGMFEDPSKASNKYLNKIPGMAKNIYNPYIQAGQRQLPGLEEQFGMLMGDPGARLNQIGGGYQESPGFQFALQQALQGSGNAAAAGGMAGSPQHEQQNMELSTNLANQDYNTWMQNALGLYGTGLQGSQGLYNSGMQSSDALARMLADTYGSQASNAYGGAQGRNNMTMGLIGAGGSLMGGGGLPNFFGGGAKKTPPYLDPYKMFS